MEKETGCIFSEDREKFYHDCMEGFREHAWTIPQNDAQIRLKAEMDSAIGYGFWREYSITKMLLKRAEAEGRLAFVGGNGMYSLLANLYGITEIDPTERDYGAEMFLSISLNKHPCFEIVTSDFAEDLKDYLKDRFGEDNVSVDGDLVSISWNEDGHPPKSRTIEIVIRKDAFVTYAEHKLLESRNGISDIPLYSSDYGICKHLKLQSASALR